MPEIHRPSGDQVFVNGDWRVVQQITPTTIASGTTDGSIIPASGTSKVRILSLVVVVGAAATNVTFNSKVGANASTGISPLIPFGANGGFVLPSNEKGYFLDAAAGAAVTVTTSASSVGTAIAGTYCYC